MKRLPTAAAALLCAVGLTAFASTVTATVSDTDGTPWNNCTYTTTLTILGGTSTPAPTISGVPVSPLVISGACSSAGVITATLTDTSTVDQKNVQWVFKVQSNSSALPVTVSTPVVGTSPNLTQAFSLLRAPRFASGANAYGYSDAEVQGVPNLGNTYYNVTTPCLRQYSLAGWTCGGSGGTTPAGTNAPQASNGAGTALVVESPNIANAAIGKSNGLYVSGDSILQATGASSTGAGNVAYQQGYGYLWQQQVGGPYEAEGTSGDQEADGNFKWVYRMENPQGNGVDPIYGHELGTNDAVVYMGDTNKQAIFQRLALGSLAWKGTPQANKTFGQSCTLAGGMAASTQTLLQGLTVQATTIGATASCVTHATNANGPIYACYLIQDANGGTFTLSLDGTPQNDPFNGTTTWNAFGDGGVLIHTQNSTNAGVACARLTGTWAAGSSHTILFTVTSATSASNVVWPVWVGSAPAPSATLNPHVVVISPNQQNTSSAGAPYVATYQGFLQTIVTNLAADGENIVYSDTANALLNSPRCGNGNATLMFTNCYNDAIHPNNTGHSVMAATAEASTPASALMGVTQWNPQQPAQNFTFFPLTPYQWLDINPYNVACSATSWCPGMKLTGPNGQILGITYNSITGMTFLAPTGAGTGFSFCPTGGSGLIANAPPLSASCFINIAMGGAGIVNFFQGSTVSINGLSIQGGQLTTGTNFTLLSQGPFRTTGTFQVNKSLTNGIGIQVATVSGCSTAAGVLGACTATVTLGVTEPDALYVVTGCTIVGASSGAMMGNAASLTTTTFTVAEYSVAGGTTGGTINCMVVHN